MKIWALLVAQVIGGLVLLRGGDALGLPDRYLFGAGALLLVALLIREAGGARTGEAQGFAVAQGVPAWPGLVLAAVSGFGLLGGLTVLMSGGATGLAVITGLIAGVALSFAIFAAPLGRSPSATLADHFRDHFGPFAGSVAAWSIGLIAFAALVLQLLLAASLLRAGFGLPGVPAILGLALLVGIGLHQRGAAGAADLCRAALPVLLALMVPAVWLSSSATGLLVPQLSWGLLVQELNAAERLAGADALYLALEPGSFALTALGVGLGAAVLPQGLNCLAAAATGEAARRALMPGYALVLLVLLALPLIAVAARLAAPLAGNALPGMAPEAALAAMVGLLEPPAWLLATGAIAVLAAIAGASVSATVTVLGALGLHRAGGLAEGSAGRSRNALLLVLLFAVCLAILAPVEPVQGHASLLVIAGAALLAPLGLALHWPRLSDAGLILGILSGGGGAVALILMAAQAGTLDLHTGLAALPLSALVTIAASLIWPPRPSRYGLLQMPEALPPPDRD